MSDIAMKSERDLKGMRLVDLEDRLAILRAERDRQAEDGFELGPKQRKAMTARIKADLVTHLQQYQHIIPTNHPNIVVAHLAHMQGAEARMRKELGLIDWRVESKKALDEQLELCNAVLVEKNEDPLQRKG